MRSVLSPRLLLLALAHFTIDAYSSFFSPLLPLLVQKMGLSLTLVGTLVALASVTGSFGQPLFGILGDRLRRPWFVALGPVIAAVFMSAIGLAPGYVSLVVLLMLGGIGVAAFHPQAAALAGELSPRRGLAMSIFVTGGTLGFSLGPILAIAIVGTLGLGRTWVAVLPGIAMSAFLLPSFAREPSHARATDRPRGRLAELRPVAMPLALLYATVVSRSAVSYGFMTFLSLHLTDQGFSVARAGLMVSLYLTLGALGGFFGGWLADRWGGRRVVLVSFLGAIPLYLGYLVLPVVPGLACLAAGSFVLQSSLPVNVVLGQELSPRHASAISSLLMGAAWGVGALLVGPVGALADAHGLRAALAALSGMLLVGLACAAALPNLRHHAGHVLPPSELRPAADTATPE
jgi:FSR family fosmidomycin resistance protein-like MFS transporter